MKAYGATSKSIDSIIEFETNLPSLKPHDLLIKVDGISINPVDTKIKKISKKTHYPPSYLVGME